MTDGKSYMDKKAEDIKRLLVLSAPESPSEEDIKRLLASIPPEERACVFREAIASEFKEQFGGRVDDARQENGV